MRAPPRPAAVAPHHGSTGDCDDGASQDVGDTARRGALEAAMTCLADMRVPESNKLHLDDGPSQRQIWYYSCNRRWKELSDRHLPTG